MNDPTALLVEAAERWGTPLYLTDLDRAATNARAWREALPGALVAYAIKANPDPSLLRRLAADGLGFEVVGPVELALSQRAGAPAERIVVNGIGQTDADLAAAAATGALVNAESLGALHALLRARAPRIGLRINPALDAATHPHLATGASDAKFGIGLDEIPAAMAAVKSAGARLESIGAHIGSAITDAAPFGVLAARLAELRAAWGVERIDLGGGFIGPVGEWASVVLPQLPDPEGLIVEPGRSVVADAGWLLTRVVRVQARGHVVVDAGMTELIRPMLYGARHPISMVAGGELLPARDGWSVSGPVCEAGDVLAHEVALPPDAGVGALLAIGQAGAYGASMASNYNGRLRPAQAVVEGGRLRLSRRCETLEDLVTRDLD